MKTRNLVAAILALGLSACSSEFSAVNIFAICAPPDPDTTSGACVYPATCGATFAGTPILDVTTAQLDFRMPLQIDNALTDNNSTGRINTNDAFITSFEMTYAGVSLPSWTVAQSVTVPTAGSSGALVRLIPVQYFPSLVPPGSGTVSIIVKVRAHGTLASQDGFTTSWFQVPVEVCAGCLAGTFCPPGSFLATCPSTAPGQSSPGQSASFDCLTPTAARQ